jgi:cytochrome P450
MWDAAEAAAARLATRLDREIEIEAECSHAAADVIFRTLFSLPIDHHLARDVFEEFKTYQRSQPILNLAALVPLPRWMPRLFSRDTRRSAARIRALITQLTQARAAEISAGTAPEDLATKIMTTADPVTGQTFTTDEMVDQVAIFFLAGHETSASTLAWALYLMALYPEWQERLAVEAQALDTCDFSVMSKLRLSRDVFRETLRLYPPVPMMVRETSCTEVMRERAVRQGSQLVISPWHLHRHTRLWDNPDGFDPGRWQTDNGKQRQRDAFIPFSAGARVCPGAGFAMIEGQLILSRILRDYRVVAGPVPVPVAHLTVRARDGIHLTLTRRER